MNTQPLSFALLDAKVSQYVDDASLGERRGKVERSSFVIGLIAGGAGLVMVGIWGGRIPPVIGWATIVSELGGVGIAFVCMVRREWRSLRQPHAQFALELDRTYKHYHRLVACLREYPHTELKRHHRYIKRRVASLAYNTGLFSGSMERLGIVPVLGVLYLQFKDWKFGDWTSLWGSVHIVGGLLLWALLLAYLASWWLIRLRSRLEAYEALLTEALEEDAAEIRS